jgi:precorrin-8X/cobalt-precorrin-8 methylmutase
MKPNDIESLSFDIIDKEAGPHSFSKEQWPIVRRMIHTSADFDWIKIVRFHPEAVAKGIAAIRAGIPIVTDTQMARMGIRQKVIESYGGLVACFMNDPSVAQKAIEKGVTRAKVAMDVAAANFPEGIYVVGNAPTALLRLIELIDAGTINPALIVGLPVGFVNAAESKALLLERNQPPFITNIGRKGGSTIAAGVINALIILAEMRKT